MFHSSVVVDVSLSPVLISSAAVPYCVHNSVPTSTTIHVLVKGTVRRYQSHAINALFQSL